MSFMFTDKLCITQVIFAHQSVLCCPVVLLFLVSLLCIWGTVLHPATGYLCTVAFVQIQTVSRYVCARSFYLKSDQCEIPLCFIVPAFAHFADQVSCNIKARKVVYLKQKLCLRESEGRSKTQLLIMDICPRYQRPKFGSQTGKLAPILPLHIGHKSSVSRLVVYKYDSLNGSRTLCNRSRYLCIIDIAPFYLPSSVHFHRQLRSYIHDCMKISIQSNL